MARKKIHFSNTDHVYCPNCAEVVCCLDDVIKGMQGVSVYPALLRSQRPTRRKEWDGIRDCPHCGKPFKVKRDVHIDFSTKQI